MPKGVYTRTKEHNRKNALAKTGTKNPNWKGDKAGIEALHKRLRRMHKPPLLCQKCNMKRKLDLANKSGKYKSDISDWLWLCRPCHMRYDGTDILIPKLSMKARGLA